MAQWARLPPHPSSFFFSISTNLAFFLSCAPHWKCKAYLYRSPYKSRLSQALLLAANSIYFSLNKIQTYKELQLAGGIRTWRWSAWSFFSNNESRFEARDFFSTAHKFVLTQEGNCTWTNNRLPSTLFYPGGSWGTWCMERPDEKGKWDLLHPVGKLRKDLNLIGCGDVNTVAALGNHWKTCRDAVSE